MVASHVVDSRRLQSREYALLLAPSSDISILSKFLEPSKTLPCDLKMWQSYVISHVYSHGIGIKNKDR